VPSDAAEEALTLVAAVRHDPALRLRLAGRFYERQPGRVPIRAYRRAELAFMRWQVSRGVLAPPQSQRPGSPWWRSANEGLLRDACEADQLLAGRPGPASSPAVARWVDFLRTPSPRAWYRAHNSSVVAGYLAHRHLTTAELPVERFFTDVALARLLCVHALVLTPRLVLGRLAAVGRLAGDPRWRGADLFLSLHRVLPDRYPLTGISIEKILAAENYAGRLIDCGVILPRMQVLYAFAAGDLNEPRLLDLVRDGFPNLCLDLRGPARVDDHASPHRPVRSVLADLALRPRNGKELTPRRFSARVVTLRCDTPPGDAREPPFWSTSR